MHYFIIAGEASGDLHGSQLISALRNNDPEARFTVIGGDKMAAASATTPVIHINDMAFMGFSEVLRNLRKIFGNLSLAKRAFDEARPDCLILIDYPSFNLKMARHAARSKTPVYYYISPKVWAWKTWRVKDIRRYVRRLFSILPFEPEFFSRYGCEVSYVGNPSVEEIDAMRTTLPSRAEFIAANDLRDRQLIALLPGSRVGEIRCNLPVMDAVVKRFPQYRAVIAGAPGIGDEVYRRYSALPIVRESTYALLASSRAAIVTSGTATLETALLGVPQVAVYRSNGSKLAYNLMKRLLKVSYVTLPNLIASRTIIPEMLLHECTVDNVAERLAAILPDRPPRSEMLEGYEEMRRILGSSQAAVATAREITADLKKIGR
ncbi:MAG: lipid-A-disaccharide synthase [Muribaculaceae bacterium]